MEGRPAEVVLSYSTYRLYDECPRRFLFRVGGDYLSPELRWRVKREARVAPLAAFVGKVVDAALTEALRHYHAHGNWPEDLRARARRIAGAAWRFSQAWVAAVQAGQRPPGGPHQPLDVHYFGTEVPAAEIQQLKGRIDHCLENFRTSGLPSRLESIPREYWRFPPPAGEPPPRWDVHGVPVWGVYDFVLQTPGGTLILDWKTGAPSQASYLGACDQLRWYALLLHRQWLVAARELRLVPVWLAPAVLWHELEVTAAELDELAGRIRERHHLITELLRLLPGTPVPLELWPLTENVQSCARCPFRSHCPGGRRVGEAPPAEAFPDPFSDD